jgi:hypothetical protein
VPPLIFAQQKLMAREEIKEKSEKKRKIFAFYAKINH